MTLRPALDRGSQPVTEPRHGDDFRALYRPPAPRDLRRIARWVLAAASWAVISYALARAAAEALS